VAETRDKFRAGISECEALKLNVGNWASLIVACSGFVGSISGAIVAVIKASNSNSKANLLAEDAQTIAHVVPGINEEDLNSHSIVQEVHDAQIAKLSERKNGDAVQG
jgi:hypothetical protein